MKEKKGKKRRGGGGKGERKRRVREFWNEYELSLASLAFWASD